MRSSRMPLKAHLGVGHSAHAREPLFVCDAWMRDMAEPVDRDVDGIVCVPTKPTRSAEGVQARSVRHATRLGGAASVLMEHCQRQARRPNKAIWSPRSAR
jgi:hypothetical protein